MAENNLGNTQYFRTKPDQELQVKDIKEVVGSDYFYKFDRSGERAQRNPKEIGISAVRGGTIVGEHEVIFAGEDEVIEFKHTAYSKSVFAKGSIEAAKFLAGKPAGYYDMRDVIAAKQ